MVKKLFLVDGHAHCYQAFYGIQHLNAPDGTPVNAVYGFLNVLRKVVKEYAPDFLAVAFDVRGPTFRHEIFSDYKATRKPPPDDFVVQLPVIRRALEAYDIPIYTSEGFEADDVIGTLAKQGGDKGLEVYLLTTDKDARQLLGPHTRMLDTRTGKEFTVAVLAETDGITPEQVVEVMALSGDSTDNVHGIRGIGPKTALELIRQWGSLEDVLNNADKVSRPAVRKKLCEQAEAARLSRELVTIRTDVPVTLDLDACAVKEPDPERLRLLFEELGFRQFLQDMDIASAPPETDYRLVDTPEAFAAFLAELGKQPRFAFDCETTSTDPMRAELVGMSFSWAGGTGWYLPVRGPLGDRVLERKPTLQALAPILGDERIGKIGQNLKYDILVMRRHGVTVRGIEFDTMVARYVLDPTRGRYGLDAMAFELLHHYCIPITSLIGEKKKEQITMDLVPVGDVCDYAAEDADIAWRLAEVLEPQLREQGLEPLFRDIELPLVAILAEMQYRGMRLDAGALEAMSEQLGREMDEIERQIYEESGETFNIASPKQLADVLFNKLGLPVKRRTRTGPSTDAEVLEALSLEHRVPALVIQFRQLSKLKSTYVDALPGMVNPDTGRIHASFNQTVTATGRLSSSDPNLQNIPVRTEQGVKIREAFVPREPGWLLLSADYSQIELRLLAHLSGDETLIEAFRNDEDIHAFVAGQIHGVPAAEVTPAMRHMAKAVNFGIVYGLTPYGLSRSIDISVRNAEQFIRSYFERYPKVKEFIDRSVAEAREKKQVETLWGRRRPIPEINSNNPRQRSFGERAAVNTVVQGSAADLMKIAMIHVARDMAGDANIRGHLLLQIHDELIFETPADQLETLRELAVCGMSGAADLCVPIKVNTGSGANWMEAK